METNPPLEVAGFVQLGILTEHCAGKFPTWLASEQVRVLSVSGKSADCAKEVYEKLREEIETRKS